MQLAAALAERLGVAEHALDGLERRAGRRHQLMAHAQEMLADDVEIGVGQQVMDVGDAAGDRVLDRDHGEPRFARLHRLQRVLERRAGDGLEVGERLAAGEMRIGAGLALIDDARRGRLAGCGHVGTEIVAKVEAELLEAVLCPYRGPPQAVTPRSPKPSLTSEVETSAAPPQGDIVRP